MRATTAPVLAAAVAVLVLAGCSPEGETAREPSTPTPSTSPSTEPTTTPAPEPTEAESEPTVPEGPTLPPELAARMPSEEEIEGMVEDAQAAYRDHRTAYDAAARTGFTDPRLVDALTATVSGDALDAVRGEAAQIADTGMVVDGGSQVRGTGVHSLVVPEEDGQLPSIVLDVCVVFAGTLEEGDGTVVRELDGDPFYAVVGMTAHDGRWLVSSQRVEDDPCPEGLTRP